MNFLSFLILGNYTLQIQNYTAFSAFWKVINLIAYLLQFNWLSCNRNPIRGNLWVEWKSNIDNK